MNLNVNMSQTTDWDKNITALARTLADCKLNLKVRNCVDCTNCRKYAKFMRCYNELAACDQLKVDDLSDTIYAINYKWHKSLQHDKIFKHGLLAACIVGLGMLALSFFSVPQAEVRPHTNYKNDDYIVSVLRRTRGNLKDVDGNNKLNCVDYSVTFKREWDKQYSPENCEILRCTNLMTGFSHLFIRCRKDRYSVWYMIEPQGADDEYMLQDVWKSNEIDYIHTFYGETSRWLNYKDGDRW